MTNPNQSDQEQKFRDKYCIASARLKNYDYSSNGAYFVTICTKNRECFFGEIKNETMQLSKIGKVTYDCWQKIPDHFPFVVLGEWVVMPNHVHGIIVIDKFVETQDFASLRGVRPYQQNIFGPQSKNLASIIRGFKIGVTKYVRKNTDIFDVWQSRFHDMIIRDEKELHRISSYIISNPQDWKKDDYFHPL